LQVIQPVGQTSKEIIMNPDEISKDEDYQISGGQLLRLVYVAKRLYTQDRLTGDEMRDLAQIIYEGVIPSVEGPVK
jgi:hypothetical protein